MQSFSLTFNSSLRLSHRSLQRRSRPSHRHHPGGLAAQPVRPELRHGEPGLLGIPQLILAPPTLWTDEEAHRVPNHGFERLQIGSVVEQNPITP
jgi:hypothetical protein